MHILNNPSKNIGRHQNNLCFWYRKRCRHIPKERYKTWLIVETWRGIDELEEIQNLLQAEKGREVQSSVRSAKMNFTNGRESKSCHK